MPVPVSVRPGVAERLFYLISPQSLSAGVAVAGLLVLARSVRLVSAAGRGCGAPGSPSGPPHSSAARAEPRSAAPHGRAPSAGTAGPALLRLSRPFPRPSPAPLRGDPARVPGGGADGCSCIPCHPVSAFFFKVFLTYHLVLLVPALHLCLPVAPPRVQPGNDFSRGCASVDVELIPLSFSTPLRAEQLL